MTNSADSEQLASDLDLYYLLGQSKSGFSRTRVKIALLHTTATVPNDFVGGWHICVAL